MVLSKNSRYWSSIETVKLLMLLSYHANANINVKNNNACIILSDCKNIIKCKKN